MPRSTDCLRRLILGFALAAVATMSAFVTDKDDSGIYVVVWPPGPVTIQIKLPAPDGALIDGSTTYGTPVLAGMQAWNNVTGVVQLQGQTAAAGSYANGNHVNEIVMDSTVDGEAFSDNTLAVTVTYHVSNVRTESDIVFNTTYTWDSYHGAVRSDRQDIRRVATHELGHVLGLDHPDLAEPAQSVTAIMNSHVSSIETLQTDDISGVQSLYGAPGFVPANNNFANASVLTVNGTSAGTNIAATAESGEPAHAGETAAHSVWWRWTAATNAEATLTTYGSNFDTVMGVYTGTAANALTPVASNDDEERGVVRTSRLTFTPAAGSTYYFAVDGWSASYGQISLALTLGTPTGSPPAITTQPASQTVTVGGSVTFTVAASGDPTGYQWYFNGSAISGATGSSLTKSNVATTDAGSYHVVVNNASGSVTSSTVTLTVLVDTVTSQAVTTGHNVTLSAPALAGTYQWQVSTDSGSTWSNVSDGATYAGATTADLTITAVTSSLNGNRYRYVVTGSGGASTSAGITLSVASPLIPFPVAVAVDAAGVLYVTDSSTHLVQKISTARQVTTLAGTSGSAGTADGTGTAARFNQPSGISATAAGVLTVTDTANATIRRVTATGVVTTPAGSISTRGNADGTGTAATFSMPIGIAQDTAGTFFIADATNHTIRRLTAANVVSTFAGAAGSSGSVDGIGSAARFNYPAGVAVDASGNLYVADTTNNLIRKITSDGTVSTLAGVAAVSGWQDGTGGDALFNQPQGLATDGSGNLYVADTGNSAIRRITPAGVVTTLAGLSTVGGLKDGSGSDAWFNQPRGLTVDAAGNIYVADTGNAAIRKITGDGVVTTLVLTAGSTSTGGGSTGGTGGTTTTPTTSSGGGGGGGAPSTWCLGAMSLLLFMRWLRSPRVR